VPRTVATLQDVLRLLPELEELEGLRAWLTGVARPDAARQWSRSGAFATVDGRVVTPDAVTEVLDEAERAMHERVEALFAALRPVVGAYWAGDERKAAHELIGLGEQHEAEGRLVSARRCFDTALALSLPLPDRGPQILALRRLGRVARGLGELQEAEAYYRRSLELALDAGDDAGAVIAETGLGNVLAMQGHFAEAEGSYHAALRRAESLGERAGLGLEIAQLFNNLAMVTSRQDREEESERWFERARAAWREIESPADLAVCLHNHALLHLRAGRTEEARRELEEAVELDAGAATRAAIAVDLAECHARLGRIREAEQWARAAEDLAIASRSTYALGHLYLGLGTLARARGETHALVFFEKALEIARRCDYQLLEAETLLDYALLREAEGGEEEAVAYLERAREIFGELEHARERERAEQEIQRMLTRAPLSPPPD
jgi:tetratricopeptide (TPR) repeat protein